MTDTSNTVASTVEQTAAAMLPEIAAAAGASNPTVAAVVALAPVALQLLQEATQLSAAGNMSPDQLAQLFSVVSATVQASHNQWIAQNGAAK
jgi:hypothetical protein